jgi:hypothetical protein
VAGLSLAAERRAGDLDAQHVATALWSLAKLDAPMESTVQQLLTAAVDEQLGTLTAQDIAQMLWAVATMRVPISNALRVRSLLSVAVSQLPSWRSIGVACSRQTC